MCVKCILLNEKVYWKLSYLNQILFYLFQTFECIFLHKNVCYKLIHLSPLLWMKTIWKYLFNPTELSFFDLFHKCVKIWISFNLGNLSDSSFFSQRICIYVSIKPLYILKSQNSILSILILHWWLVLRYVAKRKHSRLLW